MARSATNPSDTVGGAENTSAATRRLPGRDRRAALVETAAALLAEDGIDAVSMDAVAARLGVSRPLVYKHFANRDELLVAVYREKAAELEASIAAAVQEARGFEAKVRTLIRSVFEAVDTFGSIFMPLRRAGIRNASGLHDHLMARDLRVVTFFADLAVAEYELDQRDAWAAMAILLSGIEAARAQLEVRPTPVQSRFLEDLYVDLVLGGLSRLRSRRSG